MITKEQNNTAPSLQELGRKAAEKGKMFVTIKEFSKLTGLKEYSIRTIIKINGFPAIKIGVKYMVLVDEAMEWLRLNAKILDNGRSSIAS